VGIIKPFLCQCQGEGEYFECLYETEETRGENDDCTECVTSWKLYGGRHSPKNWHRVYPWIICFILWGLPFTHFPDCRSCKYRKKKTCTINNVEMSIREYKYLCRDYSFGNKSSFIPVIKMILADAKYDIKNRLLAWKLKQISKKRSEM